MKNDEKSTISWSTFSRNQKIVIGLTIFTALSHIMFSYGWDNDILGINMGVWFVINGIGYLIILYLMYFGGQFQENRDLIKYIFIVYTLGSILAWALFHTSSDRYSTLLDASLINKSVELLILLFVVRDIKSPDMVTNSAVNA